MQQIQLRRINPFQGLMIDANIWRDAHEYHRDQMRLHHLALHGWGIVEGLEITIEGRGNTLLIQPGIGIDPAGNFIVVGQHHAYRIESRAAGMVYLVVQFREVPAGPTQSGVDGVGPQIHIVEAYQIQERDRLPAEPYLELARLDYDPALGPVKMPADPAKPGPNELDGRFRVRSGRAGAAGTAAPLEVVAGSEVSRPPSRASASLVLAAASGGSPEVLEIGVAAHGGDGWDCHHDGLHFLARAAEETTGLPVRVIDTVALAEADRVDVLYLSGFARIAPTEAELTALGRLLGQGGLLIGEGCAAGPPGEAGAREFALSFAALADRLGRQLAEVGRTHPLLVARHVFGEPPLGSRDHARVVEAGGLIYSDADYGCAWQGGTRDRALPRSIIRDALEFGVNLAVYRPSQR